MRANIHYKFSVPECVSYITHKNQSCLLFTHIVVLIVMVVHPMHDPSPPDFVSYMPLFLQQLYQH